MNSVRLVSLLGALAISSSAWADQITLNPSKDNTLFYSADGSLSNGAGQHFFAGRTTASPPSDLRRGLLAFDLSSIPVGSTIDNATLTLYLDRSSDSTNRNVSVYRVLQDWGEGTSDAGGSGVGGGGGTGAPATANDATWLYRFYNTATPALSPAWTNAGGDYDPTASATSSVGNVIGSAVPHTWTGSGLVSDVQGWVNGTNGNYGWIILGDESLAGTSRRFESGDNINDGTGGNPDYQPTLAITYTVPEPATIRLAGIVLPMLVLIKRRFKEPF